MKRTKFFHNKSISLPALRGKMGDWYYYNTLLNFEEISKRVYMPEEIDRFENIDLQLGEWIQRELEKKRKEAIVQYLTKQKQRFFNSLILGIYGGQPEWQDLNITINEPYSTINEDILEYLGTTFGILTLNGDERIFAIDGQHRAIGIREAIKREQKLKNEEVSVIFVAHNTNENGKIRTRRLFSTLNRYAKPVNKKEIIILSEDDNCAIITRDLIENFELFRNKILTQKTRVIRPSDNRNFTNIIVLYDIVVRLLTNKKVANQKVKGKDYKKYTSERASLEELNKDLSYTRNLIKEVIKKIPSLNEYFEKGIIDRTRKDTSLIFRPIGQNILFDVLKIAISNSRKKNALNYFAKDDFNLTHPIWYRIFWNEETNTLATEKTLQNFATKLICEKIGVKLNKTKKDKEIFENYKISIDEI